MSVHVSAWAWDQKLGDAGLKLVLLRLSDAADQYGFSFWGQKRLAESCDMSRATIQRKLTELRERGLITVEKRHAPGDLSQITNLYRVVWKRSDPPPQSEAPPASLVRHPPPHSYEAAEPSVEPSVEPTSADKRPRTRQPDPLWDYLVEVFGKPLTKPATTNRGRVVREIKAVTRDGDPVREARLRVQAARRVWSVALSENSLVTQWTPLGMLANTVAAAERPLPRFEG